LRDVRAAIVNTSAKMPNFLIIGVEKAGTTALYHYLQQHPQIYMSPVKEPAFFLFDGEEPDERGPGHLPTSHITNIDDYRGLFRGVSSETAIGEASPAYIYNPRAPERIQYYIPDAKLIAILRNPVERAYSNFLHSKSLGREPLTDFTQALQEEEARIQDGWGGLWHYKRKGFYYEQLMRYLDRFDKDQIRVYLQEDLSNNPTEVLQDIFMFLDVESSFVPDVSTRYNLSGVPKNKALHTLVTTLNRPLLKKVLPAQVVRRLREPVRKRILAKPPQLPLEARRQLIEAYREDILKLQDLIGRDLRKWLE
jgi:Sulfotransferase family